MRISLIVAKGANDAIGFKGQLPWNCPEDWNYFLAKTKDFPVIMGTRVYSALPKGDFNGYTKLVLSKRKDFNIQDGNVFANLPAALAFARKQGYPHIFIIGGEGPYREGLEIADDLYITYMYSLFDADTYFPPIDYRQWQIAEKGPVIQNLEVPFPYQFTWWTRKK